MLDYLQLRALVSVVRAVNSFFGATRRHLQYQTDWEKAWGQWTKEYTIPSSIGSPDIRVRYLLTFERWSQRSPPCLRIDSRLGTVREEERGKETCTHQLPRSAPSHCSTAGPSPHCPIYP